MSTLSVSLVVTKDDGTKIGAIVMREGVQMLNLDNVLEPITPNDFVELQRALVHAQEALRNAV